MICRFRLLICALVAFSFVAKAQQPAEIRAMWADAFGAGFRTSSEVTTLINDLRAGNCNSVVPEVRKRGDAYYNSLFEPKATDVSPQSFDPLADLITKAHDTSGGKQRIDVHAWIVSFKIWGSQTTPPSQPNHPYNLHPDWLTQDNTGATWDGTSYAFDPALPEVQKHTYNVCMDIISRYDVDGLNFDYIRYTGNTWGYHPVAVSRFNARYGRTGTPAPTDAAWMQFRRDQVTAVVRKVYLNAIALKPQVKISADTITWGNTGVTSDSEWYGSSSAYTDVLQDWRGWMQEGILDLNIPMNYYRHHQNTSPNHALAYTNWMNFAKDRKFNRHVAIGPGLYLNYISNGIVQMRAARAPSPGGNFAEGVCGYVYKQPEINTATSFATFKNYLTNAPNVNDPGTQGIFYAKADIPVMTWKTAPTKGHLKGFVYAGSVTNPLDGAMVSIVGLSGRVQTNDATGFYGFVDVAPGTYSVIATFSNLVTVTQSVAIATGAVSTLDFMLSAPPTPAIANVRVFPGLRDALVAWTSTNTSDSQVEFGTNASLGSFSLRDAEPVTNHAVLLTGLRSNTTYLFRVISRAFTSTNMSVTNSFATAGEIIMDNPNATLVGTWTTGAASTDKFGADYVYATAGTGASATFRPQINTPGIYDVYVWYPQGGNRPTNAPWTLVFSGGTNTGLVNQTVNGGGWRLMAANVPFARGTGGYFQWQTVGAESGKVVLADGVRFVYVAPELPPGGAAPQWWAEAYGVTDPSSDGDGDGFTAVFEYITGTDPGRSSSRLDFRVADNTAGILRFTFSPFHDGRVYQLQSETVLSTNGWGNEVAVPQRAASGEGVFTITNNAQQKFFRLRVTLPQ